MLDIYLIRHAESEMNNRNDLIGGRSNKTPLSKRGIEQAKLLGKRLIDTKTTFNEVYSSTAIRTCDTAKLAGMNKVVKVQELLELDQGDWEGKMRSEVNSQDVLDSINKDNWNFTPPNGESQKDVEDRMLDWVMSNLVSNYKENKVVAIFTHGMAIKCLLRGIMKFDPSITYKIVLDNTSITRIKYSDKGWHIEKINDTSHLPEDFNIKDIYSN